MIAYVVATILIILFFAALFGVIYQLVSKKSDGSVEVPETEAVDIIKRKTKPLVESWGNRVNKKLLTGYRESKGVVVRERKLDVPAASVVKQLSEEPDEKEIDKFEDKIVKQIEEADMPEDLKEYAAERALAGKVPNRLLVIKGSRFRGKKHLMLISESDVKSESSNQLVLRRDVEPRPLGSDNPDVWYTDSLAVFGSLTSVIYQDFSEELLRENNRNLESVRKLDVGHGQKLDEFQKKIELLEDMDRKGRATNYNYD